SQYRSISGFFLFIVPAAIVVWLVAPPIAVLVISSFKSTADRLPLEPGPWTLVNYAQVLGSPETYVLLQNSVVYALATLTIALVLAAAVVWLLERTDLPGRSLIFALVMLPIAIPGMVKAIAWSLLANPNMGLLNGLVRTTFGIEDTWGPLNIYSLPGIVFV